MEEEGGDWKEGTREGGASGGRDAPKNGAQKTASISNNKEDAFAHDHANDVVRR